ncbi:MAG: AraC family transcriptional regulator [Clostridium sp.]|nr:AraC family transcriptional regulator [Clostridium sp.]
MIDNFSVSTFWKTRQPGDRGCLYEDKCIVYLSGEEGANINLFKFPRRINAFVLVVCLEGSMNFTCDLEECRLEKNTIFSCKPGMIVQGGDTTACRLAVVILDPEFLGTLNVDGRKMLPYFRYQQRNSVFDARAEDCRELEGHCAMIAEHIRGDKSNLFYDELVKSSITLFFYKLMYVFFADCSRLTIDDSRSTQSELHFKTFVRLLSQNFRSERSVGFYASQMHVSPKYLSMLIKKVSGKSASVWIDEFVVQEAKNLLKFSGLNIQEVAYQLNFANQSFFGQYFKKHTGCSPKHYKMQA